MIFVFTMPGCTACEAAEPEIDTYAVAHPMDMILRVAADGPIPGRLGLKIRATPTYVLRRDDGAMVSHEGMMSARELEKWVRRALEVPVR